MNWKIDNFIILNSANKIFSAFFSLLTWAMICIHEFDADIMDGEEIDLMEDSQDKSNKVVDASNCLTM